MLMLIIQYEYMKIEALPQEGGRGGKMSGLGCLS
jgi:hypothetical protein